MIQHDRRVAITGLGIISTIGTDINSFWKNCLTGKTVVDKIPQSWKYFSTYNSDIWSPLPEINFNKYPLNKSEQKNMDMFVLLGLCATSEALDSANISANLVNARNNSFELEGINKEKAGVFIGTGAGGISSLLKYDGNQKLSRHFEKINQVMSTLPQDKKSKLAEILNKMFFPKRFHPFSVSMFMPNSLSSWISLKYSLIGPARTFSAACSSGLIAIGNAFEAVKSGEIDIAVTGGSEYLFDEYGSIYRGFDSIKTLCLPKEKIEESNRPFDKERTGFLFSQGGSGILILEELAHARKRKANIIAEITSFHELSDAYNIMAPEPTGIHYKKMIHVALEKSGIESKDIDYINAHGTGTIANDEIEARNIMELFGSRPLINSSKSLLGHTLGACGAMETIVAALSINEQRTHKCHNLMEPIADLNFATTSEKIKIDYALNLNSGFGGNNAALILKKI